MIARSDKLVFPSAAGDRLAARLERPAGPPRAHAVFAHCFTCGKDIRAASTISRALAGAGIAVLRFDFTGLGSSDGDFANTTFRSNIEDLIAAGRYLERDHGLPRLLVGHSLGGAAVLSAAAQLPTVATVATIGAPFDDGSMRRLLASDLYTIERQGEAVVSLAGRSFRIKRELLEDVAQANTAAAVASLARPLMIFHSPADTIVSVDDARLIFEAAQHPKSFVSLDQADHLLSGAGDATYVAEVLSAWVSRYL
jgi:putative redox protein